MRLKQTQANMTKILKETFLWLKHILAGGGGGGGACLHAMQCQGLAIGGTILVFFDILNSEVRYKFALLLLMSIH